VTVVDYDPSWPEQFDRLRREYQAAMVAAGVPVAAIEHVGSTAVPGLAAKPIIDCDIVVDQCDVQRASDVLVSLGFLLLGELGIPQRWAFRAPARLGETNTYVVVQDCLSLRNHLCVRDVLRVDPVLREEYARVKRQVAALAADLDEYGRGKDATVQRILAAGGMSDAERSSISGNVVPSHDRRQ